MRLIKIMLATLLTSFSMASLAKADICVANDGIYWVEFKLVITQAISLSESGLSEYAERDPFTAIPLPNGDKLTPNRSIGYIEKTIYIDGAHFIGQKVCFPAVDLSSQYKVLGQPTHHIGARYIAVPGYRPNIPQAPWAWPIQLNDGQTLVTHGTTIYPSATID